jgi:hypothetical protein
MRPMRPGRAVLMAASLTVCACVTTGTGVSVASLIAEANARDGTVVTVHGRLRVGSMAW